VLVTFEYPLCERLLAKLCGTKKVLGTADWQIARTAKSLGFHVEIKNYSTFRDIEKWLSGKVPLIVDGFRKDYPNRASQTAIILSSSGLLRSSYI